MKEKKKEGLAADWWKQAVFYQLYPRSFMDSNGDGIGDLEGIISRLDYLNGKPGSLGIDAIWFTPFFTSPDYDYGYDVVDYCDIDPRYGTLKDFDRLLKEAHKRGIKVILDLVVNHTSYRHPWFLESRSSRDNAKRDWYIWKDGRGRRNRVPNNWRNCFFGPSWNWDEKTGQYYLHSFLKEQPDLNWENPAVREAIGEVIRFWLKRGVDGYRLDVPHIYCKDQQFRDNPPFWRRAKIVDGPRFRDRTLLANIMKIFILPELQVRKYNQHQPGTHGVLGEFRAILDSYPAKMSVGEIITEDPDLAASYYGRKLDEMHMNFYFENFICRWKAEAFRRYFDRWEQALPDGAWPAYTFNNHDNIRSISRYGGGRSSDERARLLALLLLTMRGTPFIYYGEEIGMKEVKVERRCLRDPIGLAWYPLNRGRDGCRTPMQWQEGPGVGFTKGEPWLPIPRELEGRTVAGQQKDEHSLFNLYRELISLRRKMPVMLEGTYRSVTGRGVPASCFVFIREAKKKKVAVLLNFSGRRQEIGPLEDNGNPVVLISTNPGRERGRTAFPFQLEPNEGCLLEL